MTIGVMHRREMCIERDTFRISFVTVVKRNDSQKVSRHDGSISQWLIENHSVFESLGNMNRKRGSSRILLIFIRMSRPRMFNSSLAYECAVLISIIVLFERQICMCPGWRRLLCNLTNAVGNCG